MYQVLIVSDSHGLTEELMMLKERHKGVNHVLHCGDSELPVDAPELEGIIQVKGNCDFGEPFPEEKILHIGGLVFLITHGHLHRVKQHLHSLVYYAEEKNVDVVLYGHNHIAKAQNIHNKLFINPGSIRRPRGRIEKTYAIMSWESPSSINVNYYTLEGKLLPNLHVTTTIEK